MIRLVNQVILKVEKKEAVVVAKTSCSHLQIKSVDL